MTASPTVECVEVLQSKAYVCEDELIEEYQANAEWELLTYQVGLAFPDVGLLSGHNGLVWLDLAWFDLFDSVRFGFGLATV